MTRTRERNSIRSFAIWSRLKLLSFPPRRSWPSRIFLRLRRNATHVRHCISSPPPWVRRRFHPGGEYRQAAGAVGQVNVSDGAPTKQLVLWCEVNTYVVATSPRPQPLKVALPPAAQHIVGDM